MVFAIGSANVNDDARVLVGAFGVVGVGAALTATRAAFKGQARLVGGVVDFAGPAPDLVCRCNKSSALGSRDCTGC